MDITVIVCTYNRGATLAKALDSVAASVLPTSVTWEVLVADNNSTDQTRAVAEDFLPPGTRTASAIRSNPSRANWPHALNAAVCGSQGDILAFMDDDVAVEPTWLQNLTAALHSAEWAGAGGPILPDLDLRET